MTITEATRKALDLSQLDLPPSPKILRLEVEDFTGTEGEPALRVLAVIDEDTQIEQVQGRDIMSLKRAIYDSLLAHGVELFPYVFIAKPSELDESQDEQDDC